MDWSTFRFDLHYEASAFRDDLLHIEANRLALSRLHLPQEWKADLQKLCIVRAVHGTTAIEGNPLSEQEVSRQLAKGGNAGSRDQIHRQTENAAAAFRWVENHFNSPRPFRLEDILGIHERLTAGSDEHENVPGRLRQSGHTVTVGSPQLGGVHVAPRDNKIILFVTVEKQETAEQYENELVADRVLLREGPTDHFAEERIINAGHSGDEVHLFYRDRHHSDFTYCGQLSLYCCERLTDQPSRLVFRLRQAAAQAA